MAELKEKLFSEFAPVSTEEWMAKITADLKGVPFEKKLVWKTGEGFNVNPFYRAEDIEGLKTTESLPGEFPYVRGTKKDNDWKVRQNIEVCCFKGANEKALDLLTKGVTSLGFIIKGEHSYFIRGYLSGFRRIELQHLQLQSGEVDRYLG